MNRDEQEAICFALTGAFEGRGYGQVTGNFDGQGWSLGFLQWPMGQGNAQRLIEQIHALDGSALEKHLGGLKARELLGVCRGLRPDAVRWADRLSVGPTKRKVDPAWARPIEALLTSIAGRRVQRNLAAGYMADARRDAEFYGIETLRGLALMFDVAVQNGMAKLGTNARVDTQQAFADRGGHALPYERKLKALAEAVAATCNPRWKADVLGRKLLIVTGSGKFRGAAWDLAARFGLSDAPLV